MEATPAKSNGLWKGLLAGGLIGAAAGLLFAPRAGKDTRAKLNEDVAKIKERSAEWMSIAQEKAAGLAETAKESGLNKIQETKEIAGAAVDSLKSAAGDLKDSANTIISTIKKEAEETKETVKANAEETKEKLQASDNSSLAQNEDEMKKLGKEMDAMKTNSELKKDGFVSDPAQR
ncbi:YtxH domain-containing protein [Paenibacillus sp. YN15]|uniref:YtxH domain-containing protein n=1 Tax=Paenibacillus sp. YN15 TaxID=1742774 RepID=UPI0015EC107D|nr:YtxH domain-containing protein [Paenibacillus sp. YN15]